MPERVLYPQWRDEHENTKYPFGDAASLANAEGYVVLEGTFLDAALFPIGGRDGLYLSSVEVTHDAVTLWVGDVGSKTLASGTFSLVAPPSSLALLDEEGRPAGLLVSEAERLGVFQSWEVGTHVFKPEQTQFVASVCFPTPAPGVRGVLLDDGTLLTGDVWLVGDDGVVIREDDTRALVCATEARVIRVDVVGDPLYRRRLCEPGAGLFTTPRFVRSVRVVHQDGTFTVTPDGTGDLKVAAHNDLADDTALRVRTIAEGVVIEAVGGA